MTRRVACGLLLLAALAPASAKCPAVSVKAYLLSGAIGGVTPGGRTPWPQVLWTPSETEVRWLDLAAGPRLGDHLSVMPWVVVADNIGSYHYTAESYSYMTSVGLMVAWNATPRRSPRGVVLTAGLRGCDGWGVSWPGNRFIEVSASVGKTFWCVYPSLDVGWRRELRLDGAEPPGDFPRDRVWMVLRVGLGGMYELFGGRAAE